MAPPIGYDEALAAVLDACSPLGVEEVALADAGGRVLAQAPAVRVPIPPFANSAMDGFAVRSADLASGPATLPLAPRVPAGTAPSPLPGGHAAPVATGAPIPAGADAVVPIEDAAAADGSVRLPGPVPAGRFVREPGSDLAAGASPLAAGTRLGPAEGALLAAVGAVRVRVHRRPRVAIVSTGAELVPPEAEPGPAQIRDANATSIAWAVSTEGAEPVPLGIATDAEAPLRDLLARALEHDAVVSSAGVSVGERDLVRGVLGALAVEERFWGIDLKPGRPCAFGVRGPVPVLGLPGNPASALVGVHLLVRPAIRALSGWPDPRPRFETARAGGGWPPPEARAHAVRCVLADGPDGPVALPTGDQSSHRIGSLVGAAALALLEPGRAVRTGEPVRLLRTG